MLIEKGRVSTEKECLFVVIRSLLIDSLAGMRSLDDDKQGNASQRIPDQLSFYSVRSHLSNMQNRRSVQQSPPPINAGSK